MILAKYITNERRKDLLFSNIFLTFLSLLLNRIHRYVPLSGCFHRLDPGPGHYKGTSAPIGTFGTTSRRQNCGLPVPPPGSNILRSKWDDVTVPDDVTVTEFIRSVCNSRPEKVAFVSTPTGLWHW